MNLPTQTRPTSSASHGRRLEHAYEARSAETSSLQAQTNTTRHAGADSSRAGASQVRTPAETFNLAIFANACTHARLPGPSPGAERLSLECALPGRLPSSRQRATPCTYTGPTSLVIDHHAVSLCISPQRPVFHMPLPDLAIHRVTPVSSSPIVSRWSCSQREVAPLRGRATQATQACTNGGRCRRDSLTRTAKIPRRRCVLSA